MPCWSSVLTRSSQLETQLCWGDLPNVWHLFGHAFSSSSLPWPQTPSSLVQAPRSPTKETTNNNALKTREVYFSFTSNSPAISGAGTTQRPRGVWDAGISCVLWAPISMLQPCLHDSTCLTSSSAVQPVRMGKRGREGISFL